MNINIRIDPTLYQWQEDGTKRTFTGVVAEAQMPDGDFVHYVVEADETKLHFDEYVDALADTAVAGLRRLFDDILRSN